MKTYRWTCNACEAGNDSNTTKCKLCGCPANASGEEIEQRINPKGKAKKEEHARYIKSLYSISVGFPMATGFCLIKGGVESFAILLFASVILAVTSFEVIKHLWTNIWARKTLGIFFGLNLILFLIRLAFIDNGSDAVYWMVLLMLITSAFQYFYFFRSERGEDLFNEYFESKYK